VSSDWVVLLIGGPAAVGKTGAAKRIATVSGASLLQVDDVCLALQRAIDPKDSPTLHAFASSKVWDRPTKELVMLRRELGELVSSSLEYVVASHLAHDDRIVIEGVWLTPEFMSRTAYAESLAGSRRRAVIVFEDDPVRIRESFSMRGRDFDARPTDYRDARTALEASYARWLRTQSIMRNVPIVDARPVGHLAERILAVL
jgi:2-phosphoglycerate kinase